MQYSTIKVQKVVQDNMGHQFEIDWDAPVGRCPTCSEIVIVTVHPLKFYRVTDIRTSVATITGENYLLITPNTTTRVHITYTGTGGTGGDVTLTIQLYESPTITSNGNTLTAIENKRDESTPVPPELQIFYNPSITSNGTLLSTNVAPSEVGITIAPEITPETEFILAQNTSYLLNLIPASIANVNTLFNWFEVK